MAWSSLLFKVFFISIIANSCCQEWCHKSSLNGVASDVYECSSVPPFLLSYLWTPVQISITCPSPRYAVYKGDSEHHLRNNIKEKVTAFCGLESFLDGRKCKFQMSPFWPTYVAIDGKGCMLESKVEFSLPMLASGLAGIALFYLAPVLTSSLFFRLGCGSVMFTTGSVIILIYILMRSVPHKRKVAAFLGVMGSTGMGMLRWMTGHWLPSWSHLSQNPIFQAYLVLSAILGAGLTYWFDDRSSPKANTLILMALRIIGLSLTYYGTWMMPVAFAGICGVLLTSLISPSIHENMQQTGAHVRRVTNATTTLLMSPFTNTSRTGMVTPGPSPGGSSPPSFSFWGSASAQRLRRQEQEEQFKMRALLGLPVGDEPDISTLIPLHLKTPPPDPWSLGVTPKGPVQITSFEDKYTQALLKQQQRQKDKEQRTSASRRQGSAAAASASREAAATQHSAEAQDERVARGLIFNPATGRTIKIGGDTYMRMLDVGWKPDMKNGTLVGGDSVKASGPGSGAGSRRSGGSRG